MAQAPATTSLLAEYAERFAGSRALHDRSRQAIPGGITHDGRFLKPFPVYIRRAQGAYKWDVDDRQLLDYAVGHGSLILGHSDPEVTEAIRRALDHGTHFGAGHEGEIIWAEQIRSLLPSAELVRFTAAGTESTLLAMRVARAATQKSIILKFAGHFHGWNDYALKGESPPFENDAIPGIPSAVLDTVAVVPANDPEALERRLRQGDIAGVILEPSGAAWSTVPLDEGFLQTVRELTSRYEAVLIFDEVITGFRWSPGGAQARFGVTPDLTTLAKIVAGGLPGGAVAGRADVMRHIAFRDEPGWNSDRKVRHAGTFNASPVVAAAGTTCLRRCADPMVQQRCDALASRLRTGLNTILDQRGAPGFAWGESSVFHIALGQECENRVAGDMRQPKGISPEELKRGGGDALATALELSMLLEGIHLFHSGGFLSVVHTEADIDGTIAAFDRTIARLQEDGLFSA